jgi:WD40 repeat protein
VKITAIAWSNVSNPLTYNSTMTQNPILATVSGEGVVLWNRADDEADWMGEVAILHGSQVNAIAWHPTLLALVSAGSDGRICLWEAGEVRDLVTGEESWSAIAWSPDGTQLVAGTDRGVVIRWMVQH